MFFAVFFYSLRISSCLFFSCFCFLALCFPVSISLRLFFYFSPIGVVCVLYGESLYFASCSFFTARLFLFLSNIFWCPYFLAICFLVSTSMQFLVSSSPIGVVFVVSRRASSSPIGVVFVVLRRVSSSQIGVGFVFFTASLCLADWSRVRCFAAICSSPIGVVFVVFTSSLFYASWNRLVVSWRVCSPAKVFSS